MQSQNAACFVGCKLNWKQLFDQKPLYDTCSRTDYRWRDLQLFTFTTADFSFASLVSYCFCIIRTQCPTTIWYPRHFVLQGAKNMCNTDRKSTVKKDVFFFFYHYKYSDISITKMYFTLVRYLFLLKLLFDVLKLGIMSGKLVDLLLILQCHLSITVTLKAHCDPSELSTSTLYD